MWVQSLDLEDPLEEGMATHSSIRCRKGGSEHSALEMMARLLPREDTVGQILPSLIPSHLSTTRDS